MPCVGCIQGGQGEFEHPIRSQLCQNHVNVYHRNLRKVNMYNVYALGYMNHPLAFLTNQNIRLFCYCELYYMHMTQGKCPDLFPSKKMESENRSTHGNISMLHTTLICMNILVVTLLLQYLLTVLLAMCS